MMPRLRWLASCKSRGRAGLSFAPGRGAPRQLPDLPRKQRETRVIQDHAPAIFIAGYPGHQGDDER
jgi:hypothetical protein